MCDMGIPAMRSISVHSCTQPHLPFDPFLHRRRASAVSAPVALHGLKVETPSARPSGQAQIKPTPTPGGSSRDGQTLWTIGRSDAVKWEIDGREWRAEASGFRCFEHHGPKNPPQRTTYGFELLAVDSNPYLGRASRRTGT
jgi:hypothetical protein